MEKEINRINLHRRAIDLLISTDQWSEVLANCHESLKGDALFLQYDKGRIEALIIKAEAILIQNNEKYQLILKQLNDEN
jgi:hypothetical protein